MRETLEDSPRPSRDGPKVWILEKACGGWSNKDKQGRPLLWNSLHPKARDFLSTESTFQTLSAQATGYADYAEALVEGRDLSHWENLPLFKSKLADSKTGVGRIFSPKEKMAARIAQTILDTVASADGRTVISKAKIMRRALSRTEWENAISLIFDIQEGRCAYSDLPMQLDSIGTDKEMWVSLDRRNSDGHYDLDNVHLVCRFINRWKGADDHELFQRLIATLRS
ncbi:MAG: hypothetical protein MUF14_01310 [Hyphomonadaceae bacterium]|nr:hypothetical protein [Hyphomonadaceae bacterium]